MVPSLYDVMYIWSATLFSAWSVRLVSDARKPSPVDSSSSRCPRCHRSPWCCSSFTKKSLDSLQSMVWKYLKLCYVRQISNGISVLNQPKAVNPCFLWSMLLLHSCRSFWNMTVYFLLSDLLCHFNLVVLNEFLMFQIFFCRSIAYWTLSMIFIYYQKSSDGSVINLFSSFLNIEVGRWNILLNITKYKFLLFQKWIFNNYFAKGQLSHAFIILRCVFKAPTLVVQNRLSTFKTQCGKHMLERDA